MAQEIIALLRRSRDHAGDLLSQIAFGDDRVVASFNRSVIEAATPEDMRELERFIEQQDNIRAGLTTRPSAAGFASTHPRDSAGKQ